MKKTRLRTFQFFMVIPAFVLFLIFYIWPFIQGFYYSFFEWSGYTVNKTFVGLQNYRDALKDQNVWMSLGHNLQMFVILTIFTFAFSLFFAVVITRFKLREAKVYRVIYFFPYIMPGVVTSLLWQFIYNPNMGILNGLLRAVGLDSLAHAWLGEVKTTLPSICVTMIWVQIGFFMVLFIASIENIPTSLYESAAIDGANEYHQFKSITLPLLTETMRTQILFFVTTAISGSFAYCNIMTGQNNPASLVITTYMYKNNFTFAKFGYGTTIGMIIFVITMALTLILRKLTKTEVVQY